MDIRLQRVERNTQAHTVTIGPVSLYFSYETLIGASNGTHTVRVANSWGPTTGRHFNDLGIKDALIVESLDEFVTYALAHSAGRDSQNAA